MKEEHVEARAARVRPGDGDFAAAMHEIESNLDVRRLMFVTSNVLVPAMMIACVDGLAGSHYPASLRWLPEQLLTIVGAILCAVGLVLAAVLARCQFGMVVNGNKMQSVLRGSFEVRAPNLLGVTSNFVVLSALASAAGAALLALSFGFELAAIPCAAAPLVASVFMLMRSHIGANKLSRRLEDAWPQAEVDTKLQESHWRKSLDATSSDLSVIATMATALFAGSFAAMSNLGSIGDSFALRPDAALVRAHGVPALAGFALASMMLSMRMVVRLRIALAEHSMRLAALRGEADDAWAFRLLERSFLLYAILALLAASLVGMLSIHFSSLKYAWVFALAFVALAFFGYVLRLAAAARRARAAATRA